MTPTNENPGVTKDVLATSEASSTPAPEALPVYFTKGELLPWKGRWLRLVNCEGSKIEFELVKPTERNISLAKRRTRWLKQHPHAKAARPGSLSCFGLSV